jgi:predicted Zn-dependent peptidase
MALSDARSEGRAVIRTPDQRLRVFVSSTLRELASERAADLVRLVADVARHPRLPASELERIKGDRLRNLSILRSQPQPLADEKFRQITYPDHPYGRVFPTEAMLKGYTIRQVRDFYAANFGAARSHLYVAGVFDAPAVERAVRAAFGDWARGAAPVENVPKPRSGRVVELLDRPDAVQSTIIVGLPVPDASVHHSPQGRSGKRARALAACILAPAHPTI